ncbi:hypothetical protein [Planococcus dechangensis]|uniref:Uncharacterized protein n=1 Tax=Planococcus dechangensis TaxID=1176255 RepID=A0ABV9MF62_9BACL
MAYARFHLEQKQNHLLIEEYNKLENLYSNLKDCAEDLYNLGISESWTDFDKLDDIVFVKEDTDEVFFLSVKNSKKKMINHKLNQRNLKEDKIKKLFDVKFKRVQRHLKYLDANTLGTTLNLLEEFYSNIYSDLDRNSVKENEFIKEMDNGYKLDLKFLKSMSNSNSEKSSFEDEIYSFDRR